MTPAPDRVIVAQLPKARPDASGTMPTIDWDIIPASDFQTDAPSLSFEFSKIEQQPAHLEDLRRLARALPGPAPTDANGVRRVSYLVTNPDFPNQKVKLNILAVIEPSQAQQRTYGSTYDPNAPRFHPFKPDGLPTGHDRAREALRGGQQVGIPRHRPPLGPSALRWP